MESDEEIEINTSNQQEQSLKLAKKKEKLRERKILNSKHVSGKVVKKKKLDEKKTLNLKAKSKLVDREHADTAGDNTDRVRRSSDKLGKKLASLSSAPKTAKFSSLFKNNHAIPNIGDVEAKDPVREKVFSLNAFSALQLRPHIVDCLQKRFELKKMTKIQEKSIPAILNGQDCFVKSQTGSGKTLAYAIPIIQMLSTIEPKLKRTDGIRALVLVPTRELAIQTCQVFEKLCNACVWIVPGSLIGGMKKKSEKDRIRRGLNILIATPGRLCDHLDTTEKLDLSRVDFLVFDEADRMLDMDFEKKINFIIFKIHSSKKQARNEPVVPKYKLDANGEPVEIEGQSQQLQRPGRDQDRLDPQTILISATLSSGIKEIARRLNMENAAKVDATESDDENEEENYDDEQVMNGAEKIALPAGLLHYYMLVPSKLRLIALISFILEKIVYRRSDETKTNKLVIFASTNDSVQFHENVLSTFINRQFNMYLEDEENDSDYIDSDDDAGNQTKKSAKPKIKSSTNMICELFSLYGNMDQHKRAEILSKFCKASSGILVCTDVAARGLDMPKIDWIIQYNTPGSCVDYVHRVGRTARVGHKGKALIFLEPCEIDYLKELNKLGISLNEIKLEEAMDCLIDESKYYPRQINSDRLVVARNSEECANSMQFYIEEYIEKSSDLQSLARKAYLSFLRFYSCYSHEWKNIFHIKNLHIGHVAKSFGLREAPNQIAGQEYKLFRGSALAGAHRRGPADSAKKSNMTNSRRRSDNGEPSSKDNDYDYLSSKYARDLKRLTNGHREYGNVIKKNKARSQKHDVDLSGLLKNQRIVSEHATGFDSSASSSGNKRPFSRMSLSTLKTQNESRRAAAAASGTARKVIKKNMDIFD